MVKNPSLSDAGGEGLIPGQGTKIPHAAGQFSPGATANEAPVRHREKPACHNDSAQPKKKKKDKCFSCMFCFFQNITAN